MPDRHVLIIDDEPVLTRLLDYTLGRQGYRVTVRHTGQEGLAAAADGFDGVVLLDLKLPDADGLDLVEPLLASSPGSRVVIMTAHGSIDAALEATRKGAYDFLTKTDDLAARVALSVKNAFRDRDMASRVTHLEEEVGTREAFRGIIARSPQMQRVFDTLRHALESRVTVLIQGESGTGKELVARALHDGSPRREGPYVALNCAGIPDTLLESELFGHERGAFTGAVATKKGKFEVADGGTIFLDEIGEMSLHLQSKILRVLEAREIERVGGNTPRPVDVRVVSATHRDLAQMVKEARFREDLYYRLAVFPIHLPPLRARVGDVPVLARHFMHKAAREEGKAITAIEPEAMQALERYPFPGNVRELENIISRAVVVSTEATLRAADLPAYVLAGEPPAAAVASLASPPARPAVGAPPAAALLPGTLARTFEGLFQVAEDLPTLEDVEAELIRRAMKLHGGNVAQVAKSLGIGRATLYRRLERLGGKDEVMAP